jgi:hypothetical protein
MWQLLQNKINGAIKYIQVLSSNIHSILVFPRFFWLLSFVRVDKVLFNFLEDEWLVQTKIDCCFHGSL